MSWTAPRTFITGEVETAAIFNTHLRDNMIALQPQSAIIATNQTTTSLVYVDLITVGPAVTLVTGTQVLVTVGCLGNNNTAFDGCYASVAVTGATTIAANDNNAVIMYSGALAPIQASMTTLLSGLTPGTNTFTMKYKVGTAGTGTFQNRNLIVEACY